MGLFTKKFISEEGEENLPKYKYSGSDASYLYKYVFSPAAQWCVDHLIPSWLAPNVITLLGFFCTLIPHILVWIHYPNDLAGPVPAWLCFLAAIGQITYMILDNSDGKQARKTGSSSPLGLLFDHGCDAMNTFVSGLTLFTVIQFGNSIYSLIGYVIAFSVFFMATWEEFYIESLNLPCFNGANEGIVGVAFFFLVSGIFGTSMWNIEVWNGIRINQLVIIFFSVVAVVTIYGNCKTVKSHASEKFASAMSHLAVMIYLVATCFITYYLSESIISQFCRIFVYLIGFNFAKLVGIMQASHCAHVDFDQWRTSIIISTTLLNAHSVASYIIGRPLIPEQTLIYGLAGFAFIAYAHFVYNIIQQFTNVLKIRVFRISRPLEQKLNSDFPLNEKDQKWYGREGLLWETLKNSFFKKRYLVKKETVHVGDNLQSSEVKQKNE